MWSIRESESGEWEVLNGDNQRVGDPYPTYGAALAAIADQLAVTTDTDAGLLPEGWRADVVMNGMTVDEVRDFTACAFPWRDPSTHLVPLMLQTETEVGHFGARLAGFWTEASTGDQPIAVVARGRFYDTEPGREFRDMLMGGRSYPISADPGEVEAEWVCLETEEMDFGDGDTMEVCVEDRLVFSRYEVAGCTGTPFPGFAEARIMLDVPADQSPPPAPSEQPADELALDVDAALRASTEWHDALTASAAHLRIAVRELPPLRAFEDQRLGRPTSFTVRDDGTVFGHVAAWGTCHIGRQDVCVTPPQSQTGYAYYRTGEVATASGRVPTGALTMGIGHASLGLDAMSAAAHYDDTRYGVADVAAGEDDHGIWVAGVVRPGLSEGQLYAMRASSPSGDWRKIGGGLEMVAALMVNVPGFPIPRALTASGVAVPVPMHSARTRTVRGECVALVASGIVKRPALHVERDTEDLAGEVAILRDRVEFLTNVTRDQAREYLASRLTRAPR